MNYGMSEKNKSFEVSKPKVVWKDYEEVKEKALSVAETVKNLIVDEESIKGVKKVLTRNNKDLRDLNRFRVDVKKYILEPYEVLNGQVKEVEEIIREAESGVSEKVRELEEIERDNKLSKIKEMYQDRLGGYNLENIEDFDKFITQQHLNKSTSFKSIENDIIDYLERLYRDTQAIANMANSEDILYEYVNNGYRLSLAIMAVGERNSYKETVKIVEDDVLEMIDEKVEESTVVEIFENIELVKMLLDSKNIKYRVI